MYKVKPLGAYLVESGLLTIDKLKIALNEQQNTAMLLGEVIANKGWINQQTIEYVMEKVVLPERPKDSEQSPPMALIQMMFGTWIAQAIYVAASLGIGDLLKDGAKSIEELAQVTGTKTSNLYRVLRTLASVGVFTEISTQKFAMTPNAEYLQTEVPGSLCSLSKMLGDEWHWRSWGDILNIVKTGEPALRHLYQVDNTFDYFAQNPQAAKNFNDAMTDFSKVFLTKVADIYDFSESKKVVDIGGGYGTLIASILVANPHMHGILFELPNMLDSANELLKRQGVANRCETVGGDFFKIIPSGGDAYILSQITHDWDDAHCIQLLKNIRMNMQEHGKLLVLETVVPAGDEPHMSKLMDLEMMIFYPSGRERTEAEFRQLYETAGFELTRIVPVVSHMSIIEGVCA